jgi:hypothetical protein
VPHHEQVCLSGLVDQYRRCVSGHPDVHRNGRLGASPSAITSRTVCSMIGLAASAGCSVDGGTKTLGGVILRTPAHVSGV